MEIRPYRRRAHYYETDQMGVVHHSNYIRWFEEARVDFMEQVGFGYARLEEEGIGSPVVGVACDYKASVRFDQEVLVRLWITSFTGTRMTFAYRVEDAATGRLCANGETRHCFLSREGRLVSVKKANPQVYRLFAAMVEPAPDQ